MNAVALRAGVTLYFAGHSSGRPFDSGKFSRGTQLPRDFTVPFVWDLATAGLRGAGFGHHGTQRDILEGISGCDGIRQIVCAGSGHRGGPQDGIHPRRDVNGICRLPRYYTGFICTEQDRLRDSIFPGTAVFGDKDDGTTRVVLDRGGNCYVTRGKHSIHQEFQYFIPGLQFLHTWY